MMLFWIAASVMTVLAVAFVFWPMLRGGGSAGPDRQALVLDLFNEHLVALDKQRANGEVDETQYLQLKQELEASLLEDAPLQVGTKAGTGRALLWAAGLALPLLALVFYWERGAIDDVEIVQVRDAYFEQGAQAAKSGAMETPVALEVLVEGLESRLQQKPDNTGNRYLLARSYMQQSEYVKAAAQYIQIIEQEEASDDGAGESRVPANIVGELAQAVFLAAGNRVTPEVQQLTEKALALDPNETTSLGLAGIGAFERQDYQGALQYWGRAVQLLGPSSNAAMSLRAGMARAQALITDGAPQAEQVSQAPAGADGELPSMQVSVTVADGVQLDAGATVFIYARAWQGAKLPLAIQRLKVSQLPALVTLDESMAMAPGMTLSSVAALEVVARVSSTGDPMANSGDWQASIGPVELSSLGGPIELVVNHQIP
jgi:cytochrome c-type biogenesis protein CcmH